MAELRKICKSTFLHEIKGVDPEKQINDETTTALDGIALVRKIKTSRQIYFYKQSLIMVGIQGELTYCLMYIVTTLSKMQREQEEDQEHYYFKI